MEMELHGNESLAPDIWVYLINNEGPYKKWASENDVVTPNGFDDDMFKKTARAWGKVYSLEEFEQYWNTGEIPAFCFFRFIKETEGAQSKIQDDIDAEDEINDLSVIIVDKLVEEGLVKDCTDTDDETEFKFQDIIREVLNAYK